MGTSIENGNLGLGFDDLEVVEETAVFTLEGGSAYSDLCEVVAVSWAELKAAEVGHRWQAENISACRRASYEEAAEVVHRSEPEGRATVVTVLFRRWTTPDSPEPGEEEETTELKAFKCL